MKRAPIKDLTELSNLRSELKVRAEQEKIAELQRQQQQRAAQQEAALFKTNIGNVTPIKTPDTYQHQRPVVAGISKPRAKEITSMSEAMEQWSDDFDPSLWEEESQGLSYLAKDSGADVLAKLRKGQWPAQAFLDLHGLQREPARSALAEFLQRSRQARLRSVCIIHGKGLNSRQSAVLPDKVRSWLAQSDLVMAYCPAAPADGGQGALHVLLKTV